MYLCPLCTLSSFYYATLNSLSSHIDTNHCPITGPTNTSKDIKLLENRINKFINYESNQTQFDERRKTFSIDYDRNVQRNGIRYDSIGSSNNRPNKDDLLFFPKDYEFVKLENEHLKQRLRDLERKYRHDTNVVDEKNLNLQNDLQNVTSFLKDTQRTQERSKKDLQKFMSGLLTDLEQKETMILEVTCAIFRLTDVIDKLLEFGFQLNQHFQNAEEERIQTNVDHQLAPSNSDNLLYLPTRISLRSRKPSGQSLDSGYYDGLDTVQKHFRPTPVRQATKKNPNIYQSTNFDTYTTTNEPEINVERKKIYSTSESVIGKVFRYLDTITLLKCSTVCRKWKKVAENPIFWRKMRVKNVELSSKKLQTLSNFCSQTTGITFKNITASLHSDESQGKTIKGILEHDMELIFKTCGDSLSFLKIVDCCPYLTDRTLWLASCHCRNLKQLIYISQNFPLSAPVVWSIGASCRNIDTLIVPQSKAVHSSDKRKVEYLKFNDNCLLMVARCWPKTLKTLCISGIHITVSGIAQIAQHCEAMETFEIENYARFTLNDAQLICKKGWKYLRKLNLVNSKIGSDAVLFFSENLPHLQSLLVLWQQPDDDYLPEIVELQKLKEINPNVDKLLRIVIQKNE